ncbi:MAG: HAMP domain-containing protein [Chloroflexi bacterium]|nr:HAMP domain-containing protein [Chloroflexota bacterium]
MRWPFGAAGQPSIRLRLTLWYGALFLLAGTVLLALNFALVARNFPAGGEDLRDALEERLDLEAGDLRGEFTFLVQREPVRGRQGVFRAVSASSLFDSLVSRIKEDTLRELLWRSSIALGVMAVASIGLGWFVAGRMLRPVHEIADTARRITDERLEERIDLVGPPDELKDLADQFDAMLDRLQTAFEAQREFVANASHELRTPLTIIRTEIDVTLDDPDAGRDQLEATAEVVRRAIERTEGLIDRLLVLARAEGPLELDQQTDLADAVRSALDARSADIEELALDINLDLTETRVEGDRMLLERLVGNLVDNAVDHNERSGRIEIATSQDGDAVTLRCANGGPLIPGEEAPRLFERFARLDRTRRAGRDGYGLGLSIVRAIVRAHRGTATGRALPGGGLVVEVSLPRRQAAAPP